MRVHLTESENSIFYAFFNSLFILKQQKITQIDEKKLLKMCKTFSKTQNFNAFYLMAVIKKREENCWFWVVGSLYCLLV